MIYSKNNKFYDLQLANGDYLQQCKFEDDAIFYHHHYDGPEIYNCLTQEYWEHLRNNKNSKLLHTNNSETFDYGFAQAIKKTIETHRIDPAQIYVIVYDTLHKTFLENELTKLNVLGINIGVLDLLFDKTFVPTRLYQPIKKFSMLSRYYKIWRFRLYSELVQRDLIDEFVFSFYNINPYTKTVFDLDVITKDLQQYTNVDQKLLNWILKIPHRLSNENDNVYNIWNNPAYDAILSSDIHLVVETHFENKFSVSFLTEKTYKALACSKPFLMFGTVGFLADIRELGYKTFSPYIDETYDTIADNEKRLLALVNEIKRINDLPNDEYKILLDNCNNIAIENLKIFKEKKTTSINEDNFNSAFNFLKPHLRRWGFNLKPPLQNTEGWDYPIVIL